MDLFRNILAPTSSTSSTAHLGIYDLMLLLGALFALTLLLIIWAKYIRKEKRSRRRSHSTKQYELVPVVKPAESDDDNEDDDDDDDEPGSPRRRKFRKRRRDHRSRNPTLAETGGLPPLRDENSLNPPQ